MEIPRAEIDSLRTRVTNAYDLIRRLRPTMPSSRDAQPTSLARLRSPHTSGVAVYVDGMYVGGLDLLTKRSLLHPVCEVHGKMAARCRPIRSNT